MSILDPASKPVKETSKGKRSKKKAAAASGLQPLTLQPLRKPKPHPRIAEFIEAEDDVMHVEPPARTVNRTKDKGKGRGATPADDEDYELDGSSSSDEDDDDTESGGSRGRAIDVSDDEGDDDDEEDLLPEVKQEVWTQTQKRVVKRSHRGNTRNLQPESAQPTDVSELAQDLFEELQQAVLQV